ncbi:MAG: hypothetical protein ACI9WU_004793 [Myxococcota bacterium]|jgi:hypothetical protein
MVLLSLALGCSDDPAATIPEVAPIDPVDAAADTTPDVAELPQRVFALVATSDDLIGGPKADGVPGDLVIRNEQVAFVIEGVRQTSGYRQAGGSVVDADIIRDGPGQDHFGEVIRTWNLEILQPTSIEVVSAGADGLAHIRVVGSVGEFLWAANNSFLSTFDQSHNPLEVVVDYTLGPDDDALKVRETLTNTGDKDVLLDFDMTISNHGDGAFAWAPRLGFGAPAGGVPYVGATGRELAYAVFSEDDPYTALVDYSGITILLRDTQLVAAKATASSTRWIAVSTNGPSGLEAIVRRTLAGAAVGTVSGDVASPADAGESWVVVWDGEVPLTMAPVVDGSFALEVEPGQWEIAAYIAGHPPSPRVPIVVIADTNLPVPLVVPPAGRLELTVTDQDGSPLSARVTVTHKGTSPAMVPPAVDPSGRVPWPDPVVAVAYAVDGVAALDLPAGEYALVASHGFTHELDSASAVLVAGESAAVALSLTRAVDTSGWIAADFHVHGLRSWDAHIPYAHRVREALCDGVDVPILTEHGYAAGLGDVAAELGVAHRLATIEGQEVTSLLYGHFNVFPVPSDRSAVNWGGIYPLDKDPLDLFAAMRALPPGDEIIQINHPRGAGVGGYFAWVGLDAETLTADQPEHWTTDWDAVEVFNGRCDERNNELALADWTALYNNGVRRTLSSGSDSHDRTHPLGYPRNWLPLDLADVRADPQVLVQAVRQRQQVVSCGPFVEFEALDGTGPGGQVTPDPSGDVVFHVVVSAPTWVGVDAIDLLENGQIIDSLSPASTEDPWIRLDTELVVSPTSDAWYTIQVRGTGSLFPVAPVGAPFAMTNPIDVDADGDGEWTPPGNGR